MVFGIYFKGELNKFVIFIFFLIYGNIKYKNEKESIYSPISQIKIVKNLS